MERVEEVVIVGAGIGGLATAVALKKVGVGAVVVLERSDRIRANTNSNAFLLFPNAGLALHALGVSSKLNALCPTFIKRRLTTIENGVTHEFPSTVNKHGTGTMGVYRETLLEILAGELPLDTIRFSSKVTSIELQTVNGSSISALHLENGETIMAKVVIGCDGVNSVVARWLGLSPPSKVGRVAVRGLAVFPQGHGVLKRVSHIFLDKNTRAGFVPLNDNEVHWFININTPNGEGEFLCKNAKNGDYRVSDPEAIKKEIIELYGKNFPSAFLDMVQETKLSTLICVPLTSGKPWDIMLKKLHQGPITVAGDAMHPMTPDLGQGPAAALEDAVILGRCIGESLIRDAGNGRVSLAEAAEKAIERYVKERRWRAAWLVAGSFLSGWVEQEPPWWMKFVWGKMVYQRFVFPRLMNAAQFDCGKLPVD